MKNVKDGAPGLPRFRSKQKAFGSGKTGAREWRDAAISKKASGLRLALLGQFGVDHFGQGGEIRSAIRIGRRRGGGLAK